MRVRSLRGSLALLLFAMASASVVIGCGESEPPPVDTNEIDFEEAEQKATREYGDR